MKLADHLQQIGLLPDEDKPPPDVVGKAVGKFMRNAYRRDARERERVNDMVHALSEGDFRHEWRRRLEEYDRTGSWLKPFGPSPERPDCRAPNDILAEWRRARRAA